MTIDGVGPQLNQPDPRGWLVFAWLPENLQKAEDVTQFADHERFHHRASGDALGRGAFSRAATSAERQLLQHLGYALPEHVHTHVDYPTPGVRHRSWPQLKDQQPAAA